MKRRRENEEGLSYVFRDLNLHGEYIYSKVLFLSFFFKHGILKRYFEAILKNSLLHVCLILGQMKAERKQLGFMRKTKEEAAG